MPGILTLRCKISFAREFRPRQQHKTSMYISSRQIFDVQNIHNTSIRLETNREKNYIKSYIQYHNHITGGVL